MKLLLHSLQKGLTADRYPMVPGEPIPTIVIHSGFIYLNSKPCGANIIRLADGGCLNYVSPRARSWVAGVISCKLSDYYWSICERCVKSDILVKLVGACADRYYTIAGLNFCSCLSSIRSIILTYNTVRRYF